MRYCLFLLLLLVACQRPLVNEDYGSARSINGFDLLLEHLQSIGDLHRSGFFDRSSHARYDLVIYLQRDVFSEGQARYLDETIAGMVRPEATLPEGEEQGVIDNEPVSLLLFARGTTASGAFWSRQWKELPPDSKARQYAALQMKRAVFHDPAGSSFFFERRRLAEEPFEKRISYGHARRTDLPSRIPAIYSIIPEHPEHVGGRYRRTTIRFQGGGSFFVEAGLDGARVFLVADSAPFLNYHMVRKENVALLDYIIKRSMKARPGSVKKPQFLLLERLVNRENRMKEERTLFSTFFNPPWNLTTGLLLLLFLLYIWSRLLRDRPVTEIEPESREGDYTRHFEGVGRRIASLSRKRKRGDRDK